jgi:DoxX-like family
MAYLVITVAFAAMVAFSGIGKIRRDPKIMHVIHEVVGVPLKYFSLLAACELAGAVGLVLGIWWPSIGVAAGIGLVLYFVAATVSHLRVRDVKGIGPAAFMLALAGGALALRILTLALRVRAD